MPGRTFGTNENCKLFVGNLSYSTKETDLRNFYNQFGSLSDVVVMEFRDGKSRGFGFVTFTEPDMLDKAMASRPHLINGRKVEPKRAMPKGVSDGPESNLTVDRLFVTGLKDTSKEDIFNYFSKFGNVLDVNIIKSKTTGESRGFCFVTFDDYDSVDKIILKKPHYIFDNKIDVSKALKKSQIADKFADKNSKPPQQMPNRPINVGRFDENNRNQNFIRDTREYDNRMNEYDRRFPEPFNTNRGMDDYYMREPPRFREEPYRRHEDSIRPMGYMERDHFFDEYMLEKRDRELGKYPMQSHNPNYFEERERYGAGGPIRNPYANRTPFERNFRNTDYGDRGPYGGCNY